MCKTNIAFLCCGLFLLITSSSKSQQNSINNEETGDNLTVKYEVGKVSTTKYSDEMKKPRYDLYEEFSNNTQYNEMQYENRIISTKNDREDNDSILYKQNRHSVDSHEDDDQIPMNSHTNSTKVDYKKNFTSKEVYENLFEKNDSTSDEVFENSSKESNETNIVPYEMCHNITCILLCCPFGNRMNIENGKCISEENKYAFPNGYTNDSMQSENKQVDELYQLAVYDSCQDTQRFVIDEGYQYDYTIFPNGSIYLSYYKTLFKSTSYCLGVFLERGNKFEVTFCSETLEQVVRNAIKYTPAVRSGILALKIFANLHVLSILFLVSVFLVYSILPELRNVHGYMLRHYTAASTIALIVHVVKTAHYKAEMPHSVCITLAFLEYFFIMSTFFWLSVMSCNMWQTFRAFFSLLLVRNVKQEKRKLMYYTIFAYGCPFILGVVCVVILDFISEYIPIYIRPDFNIGNCWYNGTGPFLLYFYAIKSVCIISSVCLSISSVLKIRRYEKDSNFRLTDSESKRYDNNKKWFNLYTQLFIVKFIVLGLNWTVITMSWIFGKITERYIIYIIAFLDIAQSFCTFIIFVWKKKIMLMLLKRFGFKGIRLNTGWNIEQLTSISEVSAQEKSNYCKNENCHAKDSSDVTAL